jgi:hypothetical protein
MSKGLVNFTFDVPECTLLPAYRIDVSKLLQRWRDRKWLLIDPPFRCGL